MTARGWHQSKSLIATLASRANTQLEKQNPAMARGDTQYTFAAAD
jgi:hypothetical protein